MKESHSTYLISSLRQNLCWFIGNWEYVSESQLAEAVEALQVDVAPCSTTDAISSAAESIMKQDEKQGS